MRGRMIGGLIWLGEWPFLVCALVAACFVFVLVAFSLLWLVFACWALFFFLLIPMAWRWR